MRRMIVLTALAVVALGAVGPAAAQPAGTRIFLPLIARPAQLVVVSNRGSGATVAEVAADGSGRRTLSGPTTNDQEPVLSPDGRWVAFFSTRDGHNALYVMARDGSGQRRLADCNLCREARWLPDSRRLLLTAAEWRTIAAAAPVLVSALTLLDLRGAPPIPLPDNGVPSPDGGMVAYTSFNAGSVSVLARPTTGGPPLVVAGGLGEVGIADLTWSPDGGRLAFRVIYDAPVAGEWQDLRIGGLDGRKARSIGPGELPLWSPDGSMLAFMGLRERPGGPERIAVVGGDGGEPRLIDDGLGPVWSPDGARIAYLDRSPQGAPEVLKVADVRAGTPRQLAASVSRIFGWTPDGIGVVYQASDTAQPVLIAPRGGGAPARVAGLSRIDAVIWSPDGATAAAVGRATSGDGASVYTFRSDGGGLREIDGASTLHWTPDGRLLVTAPVVAPPRIYSRVEAAAELVPLAVGAMIALAPRGDRVAYVRDERLYLSPAGRLEERAVAPELAVTAPAAWSPDGARLAVAAQLAGQAGLYVVDLASGEMRLAAACAMGCSSLSWSPDGATLLYWDEGIFTVPAAGGAPRPLGQGAEPAWSPDGRQIAYVAGDIFVMGADGAGARKVAGCEAPDTCRGPVWSPDGKLLAYDHERPNKTTLKSVRVVAVADGAPLYSLAGWHARWPGGTTLPTALIGEHFGYTSMYPYEMASAYTRLCLEQPCRPYPAGHGDVLEYAVAP